MCNSLRIRHGSGALSSVFSRGTRWFQKCPLRSKIPAIGPPECFRQRGATMKLLLFVAVLVTVLLSLLPAPASAQGGLLIYPGLCMGCVPTNVWSDGAAWWVSGTSPPVNRVPVDGENASVSILDSFTLDPNTANLGTLTIGSRNATFSGTFSQP